MRKILSFLTVVALLNFSCSKDEPIQSEELITTDNFTKTAKGIINSSDFQNHLALNVRKGVSAKSGPAEDKGITIIQKGVFGFFPNYYENGVFVMAVFFRPADIKIFPNGMGEISLHTQEPFALLNDAELGNFDNSCTDRTGSTFTFKFKGAIEVETTPWGATQYRIVPPYNTSMVYKGLNFKLNDADTYDEANDTYYCREDNITDKLVSVIRVRKENNNSDETSDLLKLIIR